jgi:hypothetical protein
MRSLLISKILILFFLFQSFLSFSQESGFEINITDDSLLIAPSTFIRGFDDDYVGLIYKAPLYGTDRYWSTYLYSINEFGDTTSISFTKEDSIYNYYDIIKVSTGDPGYLLSGLVRLKETGSDAYNIFIRLDSNLNILWEKVYKFNFYFGGFEMRTMQLMDSSFIYCCSPQSSKYMFLFQLSYTGDSIAYRAYEGDSAGLIESITYNPDSTAIWLHNNLAHYTGTGLQLNSCIEIDNQMNQTAVLFYPEYYENLPFTSKLLPDGSLISSGTSEIPNHQEQNSDNYISVFKLNSELNELNSQYLTDPDTTSQGGFDRSIDYFYSNCIYAAGTFNMQLNVGNTPSWFYVAKMNESLDLEFEKYIGGDDYYILSSVVASKDGGVLLAGTRSVVGNQEHHPSGYFIKLDSTGCITDLPENSTIQIKDVLVYPNPGNTNLKVRTALKDCVLNLFDIKGTKVLSTQLDKHITEINTTMLSQGTYIYVIEQESMVIDSGKWMKQF